MYLTLIYPQIPVKTQKYEVTALGNGKFEYDGTVYQSLSAIAREITGTRWNGKLFFGVK